jgi:hypothetical protein
MALLVYNLTSSPVILVRGVGAPPIPPSTSPPNPGPTVNVTAELKGLSAGDYTALQAQAVGTLKYVWSALQEFPTGSLIVVPGGGGGNVGPTFTATLTGPSATETFPISVQSGSTLATIKGTAIVASTSGSTETVGDTYTIELEVDWTNVSGTVTVIPQASGSSSEFTSASMVGTLIQPGTSGTEGIVTVTLPSTLDPTTAVSVTVEVVL